MPKVCAILMAGALCATTYATVFINEVFINPGGSLDDTREFIEFAGTPGMKLDGYAVAFVCGGQTKYYELGSIAAGRIPEFPEIDETFALDGLALGDNGLLVIGIGENFRYPTLLADTAFSPWTNIWNGGLDTTGKLQNDGSITIFLIRNRPGTTPADPTNPAGVIWGKDVLPDAEVESPFDYYVCDGGLLDNEPCDPDCIGCCPSGNCVPGFVDRWGNGSLDKGAADGHGGFTLDLRGLTTPEIEDDLEVVDEISYEHDKGWEFDLDSRPVDLGSDVPGLKERKVHSLDDPQHYNPDVLTRVDYRTKGAGWAPATGAVGALENGNNWQDTASEQWVRGESAVGTTGAGTAPFFYYDNTPVDPNLVEPGETQPYLTNVPTWLSDGSGTDYDFTPVMSYQIMAGRVNPLAVPFIPGDVDRDGDADADDIAKLAAVFGNPNWIFSNSYAEAPEGKDGDPALQTRPWDVDGTGDNGIEASDLQWVLNFQGDTTGRIVGKQYDSATPSTVGVYLNPNTGVTVTLTAALDANDVHFGTLVTLTVYGQVTGGANLTADQQNGIMQFVHDVLLDTADVARVEAITPLSNFATTRGDIQAQLGVAGDSGLARANGYTTAFDAGLSGAIPLYRVTLRTIGAGTTDVTIQPAGDTQSAASIPWGVKVGHTDANGDPAAASYPAAAALTSTGPGDANGDGLVNATDFAMLVDCLSGPAVPFAPSCSAFDLELDDDVDLADVAAWATHYGN